MRKLGILFGFLLPFVSAWWETGHYLTALIAYDDILNKQPELVDILDKISTHLNPVMKYEWGFVMGADYPDWSMHNGFMNLYGSHFIDNPYTPFGTFVPQKVKGYNLNNPQALLNIREKLKQAYQSGDDQKLYSFESNFLMFYLVHLMGDIHQPLHAVSLVIDSLPNGDEGGNKEKITETMTCTVLHALWDNMGGYFNSQLKLDCPLTEEMWEALKEFKTNITELHPPSSFTEEELELTDPYGMAQEGLHLSASVVYPVPLELGLGDGFQSPITLPDSYVDLVQATTTKRVALAGYRLSKFLREIFTEEK